VNLLGGPRFAAATIAVQLLMWTMVFTFFNQLAERACTAANIERRVPIVTIISASVNLLLNVMLVPRWQILGAGLAALVSEAVALSLFAVQLRQYIRLWPTAGMLCLVLLSNLPPLTLLIWQYCIPRLLSLPLALLLTIIGYIVTRTLSFKDIRQIVRILPIRKEEKLKTMC
jgi:O-antigen/teichoic acid export membrane protein